MKTDSFGVTHPEVSDTPSLIGSLHIEECGECRRVFGEHFGPEFIENIEALGRAMDAEQRTPHRSRRGRRG